MDFERPLFLFLLPLAVILLFFARRHSLAQWSTLQSALCLALRVLLAGLVVLALAGPRWITTTHDAAVIFLRDVSASISAASAARATNFINRAIAGHDARSAEVIFAGEPAVFRPFGARAESSPSPAPSPNAEATDLTAALEFASASLPADHPGRIVLLSDGIDTTHRNPLEAAAALAERGVGIDVVPLQASEEQEISVVSLKTPGTVREGEVFDLTAKLHATSAPNHPVMIKLYQNNLLVTEVQKMLPAGNSEIVFPNVRAEGRTGLYEVQIASREDTHAENNRRKLAVAHGGPARVLVIDRQPGQSEALANALRAADFEVEIRPPEGLPNRMAELETFDLIVFHDAPATDFSVHEMQLVEEWVSHFGGGFLMLGGENSFGAGGYFRTPIATLLPVKIERQEREETPVVALLVILDRSGSMTAMVGRETKMALANKGAALALDVLQSQDKFGVFAVDTRVQEVVPLGQVADRPAAARRIAGITAGGGGIYIYTSLAEAFPRLRDVQAKIKHIILFSDAADAEEKTGGDASGPPGASTTSGPSSLDLAAAMLAKGITLSVVALGSERDRDTAFLRQLAAQGGGRFYLTSDATALPRLFTLETMRAAESSLKEEAFRVRASGTHPALDGIDWQSAPLLLGRNISQLKPGANLLLASEDGDPVLAIWRYGLGKVAAFTSDAKARWASEWIAWPGFGKFWAQTARALVRSADRNDLSVCVSEEAGHLVVEADAVTSEGMFRNGLTVNVSVAATGADPVSVHAPQVAPGLYRARVKTPDAESAMIAVSDASGQPVTVAWTRTYPVEYLAAADATPLLKKLSRLTGGKFDPPPDAAFRPSRHTAETRKNLAPWLLALAVILWPLDIWLRRRDWAGREKTLPPFSPAR